jgi:hypothetical protein
MRKRLGVQAILCVLTFAAYTPVIACGLSSGKTELPTGDVWISRAERVFVPHEALTPLITQEVDVPLGDTLSIPKTSVLNFSGGNSPELKVKIFLTLRRSEMLRPGKRPLRYRQPGDFARYGDCFRHRIRPAHCFRWAYQERRR